MRRKTNGLYLLMLGVMIVAVSCGTLNIGQKPVLSMQDVRSLAPQDLADFSISLYNKQADWYKDQMKRVELLSDSQKQQLVKDYELLVKSWPWINLYDSLVSAGRPVDANTQTQLYRFVERYLGGN